MGNDEISNSFREKLGQGLDEVQMKIDRMLNFFRDSLNIYSNLMQNSLNNVYSYADEKALIKMHQNAKNEAIAQV